VTDEELKQLILLMRNDRELWRRYYAGQALSGLTDGFFRENKWDASRRAFEYADAMLHRLESK